MLFSGGGRGGGALSKCFKLDIAVTFISKITTIYSIINLKRTMRKLFYLVKIDNSLYPAHSLIENQDKSASLFMAMLGHVRQRKLSPKPQFTFLNLE